MKDGYYWAKINKGNTWEIVKVESDIASSLVPDNCYNAPDFFLIDLDPIEKEVEEKRKDGYYFIREGSGVDWSIAEWSNKSKWNTDVGCWYLSCDLSCYEDEDIYEINETKIEMP